MRSKPTLTLAFVDCITCALGGVLLILFTAMTESREVANALREKIAAQASEVARVRSLREERNALVEETKQLSRQNGDQQRTIANIQAQSKTVDIENDRLRARIRTADTKNSELARQIVLLGSKRDALLAAQQTYARELIGVNGQCKHVVFLFDSSGSMQLQSFDQHKSLLALWIHRLDFETFNVISFSNAPNAWTSGWAQASPANRASASEHVDSLRPHGMTATLAALKQAFELPDLDTIILFSDGAPSDAKASEILAELEQLNQNDVVINVVAIGNYFVGSYGTFLRDVAQQHGGVFLGR